MVSVTVRRGLALLLALGILAWCGWASGFRVGTRASQTVWGISLAAVLLAALAIYAGSRGYRFGWRVEPAPEPWPRPGQGGRRRALAGTATWLALAVIVLAWEILGIATGPHEPHMTISALSLAFRPMRAFMLAVWMGVGVSFAGARARSPAIPIDRRGGDGRTGSPPAASAGGLALGSTHRLRHAAPLLALLEGRSRAVGVGFWIAVVVCAGGIDIVARRSAGRIANFEELLRFISHSVVVRLFLVVAWVYAGWHLFAH
jgi:hypothetical protein